MTTSFLARQLITLKLDKNELTKVKCLRKNTLEEKHKLVESLQQILTKQTAQRSCRLCLRPGHRRIFNDNWESDIATDIKYLLGIEVTPGDGWPQHICRSCESTVQSAAGLKQLAEATQWRLQQELQLVTETTSDLDEPQPKKHHGGYFNVKGTTVVREWVCRKCSRTFQNREEFSAHEAMPTCRRRRHHGKGCVCETCGRELKSLFLLKRHRLTHTDEPGAFKCSYCPYRARTKYSVTVHERWHTGDRPLSCPVCSKTFPNASNLWAHKRRHLPPKYHCDMCARSFRFKQLLIDHIASQHSTEKRNHCDACGKAFATRKKMLRHERRVHNRPRLRQLEKTYLTGTEAQNKDTLICG